VAVTLGTLVSQVQGRLDQYSTNRTKACTFKGWVTSGATKVGVKLADVSTGSKLTNVDVELGTELVRVTSYDSGSTIATCPPWFRQQQGTPLNDAFPVDSKAVVSPRWPAYHVAETLCDGITTLYPDIFAVKEQQLTSSVASGNYEVATDVDGVLKVTIEDFGPWKTQFEIKQWTLDTLNPDGKKYLRMMPAAVNGRPIYVTYRAKPVVPDPALLDTTWASTGLPDSSADLPVLYAVMTLIASADAAKTQTNSIEQSDRSRFVQAGAASSSSRRFQEMYTNRLAMEKRKLSDRFPPRVHKTLNG